MKSKHANSSLDPNPTQPPKDRQMVESLARGLALLSEFRASQPLMSNSELANATQLPRSSVSRLTHTLVKLGYLEYESDARAYRLGPRVLAMGYAMRAGMTLRQVAIDDLSTLAKLCGGLAGLATPQGYGMLMVEVVHAVPTTDRQLQAGVHTRMEKTAMGRVHLITCDSRQREDLIETLVEVRGLSRARLNAIITEAQDEYAQLGVCTALQTWRSDHSGVATDLVLPELGSRMVLTCGAPHEKWEGDRLEQEIIPAVRKLARRIEDNYARHVRRHG